MLQKERNTRDKSEVEEKTHYTGRSGTGLARATMQAENQGSGTQGLHLPPTAGSMQHKSVFKKKKKREKRAEKYEILSTLMVRANALLRVLRLARWWLDSCSFGAFLAPILARGFCQDVHLFAH